MMPDQTTLLIATPESAELVRVAAMWESLQTQVAQLTGKPHLQPNAPIFREFVLKTLQQMLVAPDRKILVVRDSDRLLGFATASILPRPWLAAGAVGLLSAVWVEPDARRRGLAKRLVQALEDWLKGRDVGFVEVNWDLDNAPARDFWRAAGYRPDSHSCTRTL